MYKQFLLGIAAATVLFVSGQSVYADSPADKDSTKVNAKEKPFWDSAQAFLDAFQNGNANAIGEMFTEDAEFFDEFGERTIGREAIVAMFQDVFGSSPDARMEEIVINRIRFITDTVAMEEGHVVSSESTDNVRYISRYVALHTKGSDGKWRINTLKDFPRETGGRQEQLAQLAWLTGEWFNEDADTIVHTTGEWSESGNYLLRRFTIKTEDGRELKGVQRIGWDAAAKKIRSWTFDSAGGFMQGFWTRQGNRWLISVKGVNPDGETISGTAEYTLIDAEMIQWKYRDLTIGAELREDAEPITMVRRPPLPAE